MKLRILDFPSIKPTVGKVLSVGNDHQQVDIVRCVQGTNAHLSAIHTDGWHISFQVRKRRFQCTVAELCAELRACSAAAAKVGLPNDVQHALDEVAYALAAYIAEMPPDGTVTATMHEAIWSAKGHQA